MSVRTNRFVRTESIDLGQHRVQPRDVTSTTQKHHRAIEHDQAGDCWVRVWFGHHVVCQYTAAPTQAERYAEAMRQRFVGLRVTVDKSLVVAGTHSLADLPRDERLWELTP